jgi:7,8-dihydro-6-hydroxymethylpterin-pyrophosphokinase
MDLDLLLYGTVEEGRPGPAWKELGPHGRMVHTDIEHRAFVAQPLMELAPELVLPPYGTPLRALAEGFRTPGGRAETLFTTGLRSRFLTS